MIGLVASVRSSRTDKDGQVFLTVEVSPQYRLKAAAVSAMVHMPLIVQIAAEETRELPLPAPDLL